MDDPTHGQNPSGLCWCGCGGTTAIARFTNSERGNIAGEHVRFIKGHSGGRWEKGRDDIRSQTHRWVETDRGFASPCWIWLATSPRHPYGQLMLRGRRYLAHRRMYEEVVGPIPPDKEIDHLCRQPACVNPEHLEPVTTAMNQWRGLNAKLTPQAAREIRASALSIRKLAAIYGVTHATVWAVKAGRTWRDA